MFCSNLENCIKLENQIVGVQNTVVAEFDTFLERLKEDVLTAVKTSDETAMGQCSNMYSYESVFSYGSLLKSVKKTDERERKRERDKEREIERE